MRRTCLNTSNSASNNKAMEMRKTTEPAALVFGFNPERNIPHISTGKVTSKRDSRKEIMNSSQENVTERKKLASMEGSIMGAVINRIVCHSFAPRSRAARSILI